MKVLYRFNRFIEKWMALVTPACLAFGVLFPQIAKHGVPFVPYVFAFMTFTGALKSRFRDVANVFKSPGPLLMVMALLHLIIPGIVCGVGNLVFPDNSNLVTGMVLEFSVPTAVSALMWVMIYNGNLAISLALVVVDTVLAPVIIPVTLRIFVGSRVHIDMTDMICRLIFMVALPAIFAMTLNQLTGDRVKESWPSRLAPFSKLALIFVVASNSSGVAPYVRHMNQERVEVAVFMFLLAAGGYASGLVIGRLFRQDRETQISMMYGAGMRNISTGAVIATTSFPGEVLFPVLIATLFQQMLAALYGKMISSSADGTLVEQDGHKD